MSWLIYPKQLNNSIVSLAKEVKISKFAIPKMFREIFLPLIFTFINPNFKMERTLEDNFQRSSNFISRYSYDQLVQWGVSEQWASYVNLFVLLALTVFMVYLLQFIVFKTIRYFLFRLTKSNKRAFLKQLMQHRFSHFLAMIAPVTLIYTAIPIVFDDFKFFINPLNTLLGIYAVLMVIWIVSAVINAVGDILRTQSSFRQRPIESYLQVVRIILYLFGAIVVFSQLTGKSPVAFFGVLGAASAVLLLMFKDTIMGFVASIQVTTNDMVRIGDWIEMPTYGADGDVLEITLTTVKVQNWDKTITTIPTHALISSYFVNWRGMQEFGGRRIKRSIIIKQSTIRYLADEELDRFRKIEGIRDYIKERKDEIDAHNLKLNIDRSLPINGRNLTNAGLFRKYAQWYIENHPGVHKDKTVMLRQLAPTPHGLPFEVYLFTKTVAWVQYEAIMADIFDHLIAAVPFFDLEIHEDFAGTDYTNRSATIKTISPESQ